MGWQTREHWRNGHHQVWLMEMHDVFSSGWRVAQSWPTRHGESFTSGRYEQPPDRDRHAAREVVARKKLAERMAEVEGDWEQVT
jgi:hypothetical protein